VRPRARSGRRGRDFVTDFFGDQVLHTEVHEVLYVLDEFFPSVEEVCKVGHVLEESELRKRGGIGRGHRG
jgi:hypothetical protein